MGAEDYWVRFEFQWRMVIHCHGVAWIPEPDDGLVNIGIRAKIGYEA